MEIITHEYNHLSPFEVRHIAKIKVKNAINLYDRDAVESLVFDTATKVGKSPYAYDMLKPKAQQLNDGTIRVTWDRFARTGD